MPFTTIVSAQVNANFSVIASVVNGNLDNSNISPGANISLSKLNNSQNLLLLESGSGVLGIGVGQTGDTVSRVALYSDGSLRFGPGAASALDFAITRTGTSTVQVTNNAGGPATIDDNAGTITNVATLAATTATITNYPTPPFGQGNYNPPPTTGTLTGEYWTSGNWTTTGNITCNHVRLHVGGNVTINNPVTVNTELASGAGLGSISVGRTGTVIGTVSSTAGGSYGGQGGVCTSVPTYASSSTYSLDNYLGGSAGTYGDTVSGIGGSGGGGLYIECAGNVTIGANITANGGAGAAGGGSVAGSGGSGGAIDIRCLGTTTISAGSTLAANGGAGANNGTGGGGGGGGCIRIRCASLSNGGTITVTGGAAGTGGTVTSGATGFTDLQAVPLGPRMN